MAGPFDYTIDVKSPFENIAQGYQLGAGMLQARQAQEDRALALQQRQAEMERQKILNEKISGIINNPNPTARDFTNLAMLLPAEQAKRVRENWQTLNEDNQKQSIAFGTQVLSAFNSDAPQVGIDMLRTRAEAMRNSGDEAQAKAYESWASIAEQNPKVASLTIGTMLAAVPGGDKALESVFKAQKQPAEVMEAEAKAETAAVTAKYADTKALLELDEIKNDMQVKRMNSRIYAATAAASREANDLKRQELGLKIEDMIKERDTRVREKASEAETAINGLQDTQAALADILSDQDTLRAAVGSSAWRGAIPGTKARTMAGKIEQLQNMMTESMLGKLKGAMSDSDLKFLRNIGTNMDRYQNEDAFIKELNRISGVVERTLQNQRKKYGISAPVQATSDAEIDALLEKYGVQ